MYVNVNFSSVKLDHDSELYGEKYQKVKVTFVKGTLR